MRPGFFLLRPFSSLTARKRNFATMCLFVGLVLVGFLFANFRWNRKKHAGASEAALRRQQIQRLSRENMRLAENVQKNRALPEARATLDEPSASEVQQGDHMAALREVVELRRRGLVSLQSTSYKHQSGSTRNALNPIEPDFRSAGLAPAFIETFGLSVAEASELASAWRETKQKLEEATMAAVVSRMNGDGSLTIEVKRPLAADSYLSALRDSFSRVLGPERFEMFDGLMGTDPIVVVSEGATFTLRSEPRGRFEAYLSSRGGSDYTLTISRRPEVSGEMNYQLTTTIGKPSPPAATDFLRVIGGEWHEFPLPKETKSTKQTLSSRDEVILRLGPLLGRFLPPDF